MNNPLVNPGFGTFVWMIVSFGILAFILMKFGWPIILKSLKKREEAIANSLNEAAKAREEMKHLVAHNEELLRQAREAARAEAESLLPPGERLPLWPAALLLLGAALVLKLTGVI